MARTIEEIQKQMIDRVAQSPRLLATLTSTSLVAIWRLWIDVVSYCHWWHEQLFDQHKAEVNATIDKKNPHSLQWYGEIATAFQYGFALIPESDKYDNTGVTADLIAESKIVAYAAVIRSDGGLRIKVARNVGDDLAPLTPDQLSSFMEYMERVVDAGVNYKIESRPPDSLKLELLVYVDPLIFSADGSRIDGTINRPVEQATKQYLKQISFNGVFILEKLVDKLQSLQGVRIPHVVSAQARYGALAYTAFNVMYNPDAGYLRFVNDVDLNIKYVLQSINV